MSVTSPVLSCACACGAAIATAKKKTAATSGCTTRLPKLRRFVCTLAPCSLASVAERKTMSVAAIAARPRGFPYLPSPEYIHAGERVGELRFEAIPVREIRQRPIAGKLRSVTRGEIGPHKEAVEGEPRRTQSVADLPQREAPLLHVKEQVPALVGDEEV